jgi:hypothetical protein
MADENVQNLQERLLSDDSLLEDFKQRPHEVLSENGIELSEEQKSKLSDQKLHEVDKTEVRSRIENLGVHAMF